MKKGQQFLNMNKTVFSVCVVIALLITCIAAWNPVTAKKTVEPEKQGRVVPGIEVFLEGHSDWVKGKKVGLITNPTGVNRELASDIDLLHDHPDVQLTALFGPEHGIRGDQPAGEYVESYIDERTGLPVYSLYGPTWKPTEKMLEDVDVLLFDIQDIGSNVYTYIYTLGFAMEAAAEFDKRLIVLDRPNPIGGTRVEGPVRDEDTVSFMGRFLLPVRHGMTIGELATMWNHEYALGIDLRVAKMKGWQRTMHYEDTGLPWVLTSPNIPTPDSANLYAGTELVDNTPFSTGLGTTKPFELVGAPWINGEELADELNSRGIPGVTFRPAYFTPMFSQYEGERVDGVQVHIQKADEIDLVQLGLHLVDAMRDQQPEKFNLDATYDELIGDKRVRPMLEANAPIEEILNVWQDELDFWTKEVRNRYLLYGPYPKDAKPYKPKAILGILPLDLELAPGQSKEVTVHGVDANGRKLEISPEEIDWEVKGDVGYIENGVFTAVKEGKGKLVAKKGDMTAERNVVVAKNVVENIRYGVHSQYTRIVFDLNKTTEYDIKLEGSEIVVSVPYAEKGGQLDGEGTVTVGSSPVVSSVHYSFAQENMFEARLQLKRDDVAFQTPTYSNRVVIDVMHGQ